MKKFIRLLLHGLSQRGGKASRHATLKSLDSLTPLRDQFHQTKIRVKIGQLACYIDRTT